MGYILNNYHIKNNARNANRVASPTSKHWQGEALTPLYVRFSYTAVH